MLESGKYQEAEAYLRDVIQRRSELDPKSLSNPYYYALLAEAIDRQGRRDEAMKLLEVPVELHRDSPKIHPYLAAPEAAVLNGQAVARLGFKYFGCFLGNLLSTNQHKWDTITRSCTCSTKQHIWDTTRRLSRTC